MARKKTEVTSSSNTIRTDLAGNDLTEKLGSAFSAIIKRDFGQYVAPSPIVTPTGIRPLDCLLGGGIVSSKPVMISSTPETGKSTFCFQFSKIFQDCHENGVIVYLDIEGAGNAAGDSTTGSGTISRIVSFGLDLKTFQYQPVILTVSGVFDLIEKLSAIKQAFEEKLNKEFYVLIIWDSISATRSSKTDLIDDHNQMIGFRAREITFKLEKFSPMIAFKRFTLIIVDQVRANLSKAMDPYAQKEKSVGDFKDYKSSTSINSLNHLTGQWLFFSKKKSITIADGMGLDGWYINVLTEKNKNAPSQYIISCVFDKSKGFDKFWTEYNFMSEMCPSENTIYKKSEAHLKYPLVINQSGPMVTLNVVDEANHKNVLYKSNPMYRKNIKNEYDTNDEFKQWFDYAVELSCQHRIINGLFKCEIVEDVVEELIIDEPEDYDIPEPEYQEDETVELI